MNSDEAIKRLKQALLTGENDKIEFMEDFPDSAIDLAKEIASFATSNQGSIYLGVNDDVQVVGTQHVNELHDTQGRDSLQQRISGITRGVVKPPIRVAVEFVEYNGKIVVEILVPKGVEPIYYIHGKPYLRDLSISRPAEPNEVKELHQKYFRRTYIGSADQTLSFLISTIQQFSDVQVLWGDHENRNVNPDLEQMQYDLGASGRILQNLSRHPVAERLRIIDQLKMLGVKLEDLESHEFYLDGGKSWNAFKDLGNECMKLTDRLYTQLRKRTSPSMNKLEFKMLIGTNLKELDDEWMKGEKYLESGRIGRLKEVLRRLAYTFHRLGSLPEANEYGDVSFELRGIGERLMSLSSQKYFASYLGWNPLEKMKNEMDKCLELIHKIKEKLRV